MFPVDLHDRRVARGRGVGPLYVYAKPAAKVVQILNDLVVVADPQLEELFDGAYMENSATSSLL